MIKRPKLRELHELLYTEMIRRPKLRELHELLYAEIVKSGTIRLVLGWDGFGLFLDLANLKLSKFTTNAKQWSFSILCTLMNRGTRQVFTVFDFKMGDQFHETLFLKGFCIFLSFLRVFIFFFIFINGVLYFFSR